jgi:hypothetical protein
LKTRGRGFSERWPIALPGALLALALALSACTGEPAALRRERKLALLGQMQSQLDAAVDAEKSAVLATTDEESKAFVEESKRAAEQFEASRAALRPLLEQDANSRQLAALRELDDGWTELESIDAKLLGLALANTNRKAAALSAGQAAQDLGKLVDALTAIEGASADPAQLRELSRAKAAALWIQTLHAPHIASPSDAEMTGLEGRMRAYAAEVDGVLAGLEKSCPPGAKDQLAAARDAWTAYQADGAKVVELSRANSNVIAFDLSVHEGRRAARRAEAALAALEAAVSEDVSKATR